MDRGLPTRLGIEMHSDGRVAQGCILAIVLSFVQLCKFTNNHLIVNLE